jgi:hypothetical protein
MEQLMFDYKSAAKRMQIPPEVLKNLEMEIRQEFPNDDMLMELHVLRAIRAYVGKNSQVAK